MLFKLLEEGKIEPIITKKFPILEAVQANEFLESGLVVGNIILAAPARDNGEVINTAGNTLPAHR